MLPLLLLLQAASAPAASTTDAPSSQHLHDVVVEAIRNCPKSTGDEIAVCARDHGYAQRYRMEKLKPYKGAGPSPVHVDLSAGPSPCTTTGPNGSAGCSAKAYDEWRNWKKDEKAEGRDFPW